jgi:hypothetical protein
MVYDDLCCCMRALGIVEAWEAGRSIGVEGEELRIGLVWRRCWVYDTERAKRGVTASLEQLLDIV